MQETRKQLLREMCDEDSVEKQSLEKFSNSDFKNLVVDDNHGIIYCYIPKVIQTLINCVVEKISH